MTATLCLDPSPFAIRYHENPGPHRRVQLIDPKGASRLSGATGALIGEYRMGDHVTQVVVRLGGGVEASVAPSWIKDLPAGPPGRVLPFPRPTAAAPIAAVAAPPEMPLDLSATWLGLSLAQKRASNAALFASIFGELDAFEAWLDDDLCGKDLPAHAVRVAPP